MLQGFQFAFRLIRKRPLRMGLTLLQVAVGVAAITIVLSFIFNLLEPTNKGLDTEGLFWIEANGKVERGGSEYNVTTGFFTSEIVKEFRERSNYIQEITISDKNYQGIIEYDHLRYQYHHGYWVGKEFAEIMNLQVQEGSFFTQMDIDNQNPVVAISEAMSKQLFGEDSAIGKKILHSSQMEDGSFEELEIIGVYASLIETNMPVGENPHLLMPYSLQGQDTKFMAALVRLQPGRLSEGKDELNMIFQHTFNKSADQENNSEDTYFLQFTEHQDFGQDMRKEIAKSFGLFIGSFAFVALVVSSIGVLSMMLVSIVERTREIGLRRALGATRLGIVGQVLSESVMISFLGGILGIFLAYLGIGPIIKDLIIKNLFQDFVTIDVHISLNGVLISLLSVVFVGLIAGLYPGIQASRLAPLEAVREVNK